MARDAETGLTEKQKAFCDYYITCHGNATEAAKQAGYKAKNARGIGAENLTKPNILKYIQERMKVIESNRIASAEECMQILTSIARGEGKDSDKVKAIELVLRVNGSFNDKLSIKTEGPIVLAGDELVQD